MQSRRDKNQYNSLIYRILDISEKSLCIFVCNKTIIHLVGFVRPTPPLDAFRLIVVFYFNAMNRPSLSRTSGRHFLQNPGPTNVPDRILRAMDRPTIDHRSGEFARLGHECLEGMKAIFKMSRGHVFIYP